MPTDHLPISATPFVGRVEELSSIATLLADPNCRLLTLVGSGGIGKTRIACETAEQLDNGFTYGSYFVPLGPIASSNLVALTIASSIGLLLHDSESPRAQVIDYLCGRELLLILDNFEHLMGSVDLIIEILQGAPDVRLLVTSRERLNIREEWVLDIYGFDYPQDEIIDSVEQYSAIQFFLKCASRVKPDFQLTQTIQKSVIRICRLVEGIPLGIELAASWVRTLSCQAITDEIERNLDFLTSNQRNMPEKHGSIRAVFDQSYNLLTREQQEVFKKLSVFRSGFRREAAEAVADASLMTLVALVDKSLLRVSSDGRYDMHELLRQYGEEQLRATGSDDGIQDAHCKTFTDFIHQRVDDLKGRRQLEAIAEIKADFENVRTAWNRAVDHNNADAIDKMLDGLTLFCDLHSRMQESWALLDYAKKQFADDHRFERVWDRLVSHALEEANVSHDELQTALQIAQRYNDLAEIAACFQRLAADAHEKRDFVQAKQLLEQSLMHYRQLGDRYWVACVLFDLMSISYQGIWSDFKLFGEESLRLRREIGDRIGAAWSLAPLAVGEGRIGHFAEAERLWFERIALGQETGTLQLTATTYGHLSSQVYFIQGDFDKTRSTAEEALKIASSLSYSNATGLALVTLGLVASIEERYDEGKALCEKGASTKAQPYIQEMATWGLSIAACGLGDYTAAGEYLAKSLKYLFNLRGLTGIIASLPIAAMVVAHRGNPKHAVELLALALTHPVCAAGWMEKWMLLARWRADQEWLLGSEAYWSAWERGKLLDAEAVAEELKQQFSTVQNTPQQKASRTLLTERELEVLALIATGLSNQQIADHFVITAGTAKWYVSQIFSKLDVNNRTQAVARARELDLIP